MTDTPHPYGLTPEQIANLQKLVDGLKANPDWPLDMRGFAFESIAASKATPEHPCGSCMCLVGSGPSLGVPMTGDENRFFPSVDVWLYYSRRAFIKENDKWSFAFASEWTNSIPEAIKRLEMVVAGTVPEKWTFEDRFAEGAQ